MILCFVVHVSLLDGCWCMPDQLSSNYIWIEHVDFHNIIACLDGLYDFLNIHALPVESLSPRPKWGTTTRFLGMLLRISKFWAGLTTIHCTVCYNSQVTKLVFRFWKFTCLMYYMLQMQCIIASGCNILFDPC